MPIDCKKYKAKEVLQLLRSNSTFNYYIREGKPIDDLIEMVKSRLIITEEQELEIIKYHNNKFFS